MVNFAPIPTRRYYYPSYVSATNHLDTLVMLVQAARMFIASVGLLKSDWLLPNLSPKLCLPHSYSRPTLIQYSSGPVSMGNTFHDLPRFCETADNTERYL
jgi:hypothetical protein